MKPSFSLSSLLACALWTAAAPNSAAEASPYRGLWVGEVALGKVNEVTVPLDAQNIPRAPDPNTPTPTFDAANFRLIVHVDAMGRASLLKQVAILARKSDLQKTESDMALVTDERLYGSFPPQAASRISSVVFDFGDAKATAAVNEVIARAAAAAATAAQAGGSQATVKAAAQNAATPVIAQADAAAAFATFLQTQLDATKVRAIANGGSTSAARSAANALKNGSFYQDNRGNEMLDAIESALAGLPGTATAAQREQAALNTAAAFAETDRGYDRFLAGELIGDAIEAAADKAASTAEGIAFTPVTAFQSADSGTAVAAVSAAHGLVTGDQIAIQGAALSAYNGLHTIVRIDNDSFRLAKPFVAGGAVGGFAASSNIAPLLVTSPGHGLTDGARITVRGSLAGYNGSHLVTVLDGDTFSLPIAFASDPADRGLWSVKSGDIVNFESTGNGSSGVKITSPGHGLDNGTVIEIQGSGQASYNGLKTITRIDADSFSIPVAFGGNPAIKGSWDIPREITDFAPPAVVPTLVSATAHGLTSGDRIVIAASGNDDYNATHEVTVVSANAFSIPIPWDAGSGDPAVKGTWAPATGGQWRKTKAIRDSLDQVAKVAEARTAALNAKLTSYSDTRAPDALELLLSTIIAEAALSDSPLSTEIAALAETAAREALAGSVGRYPRPTTVPSTDYTAFVRSATFAGSVATAAEAAATAARKEKQDLLATTASIKDKAQEAAINALAPVLAAASRSLLTELPMSGNFATSLATEVVLPANHPTNPFRHRRHPDHTTGIDIRRLVNLSFQPVDGQTLTRTGYGVDRISGIYAEEIHGLHKPLGPAKNVGLKVAGTFQLHRISLIDTLNGR
jgi:hypothetical protein